MSATRIERNRTVLLVIDVQERLLPVIAGAEELQKRVGVMVDGAAALGVPALFTEQYPKGLGHTVPEIAERLAPASPVEKVSFSCCGVGEIDAALAKIAPATVLVVGIETHVCVLQTCLDLLGRGMTPVLVADCVGSRHEADHHYAIERLRNAGAIVSTAESVLFELTGTAGTDEFRQISRLVKPL